MTRLSPLPRTMIEPLVQAALNEDFGRAGDITTEAVVPAETEASAKLSLRKPGTLAGIDIAIATFQMVDPSLDIRQELQDGDAAKKGAAVLSISGRACSILMAERVALNFAGRLSGIATATAEMMQAISHTQASVTCTRKTTPGMRMLEKRAVRLGGGSNHRFGLDDAILIKDNHIAAAGDIGIALDRAVSYAGHMTKILIEVDNLDQLDLVIAHGGADNVMLDNMSIEELKIAVARVQGTMKTEASGNVTIETVSSIAETGVDYISSGWLTHSAPNLDLGLDF